MTPGRQDIQMQEIYRLRIATVVGVILMGVGVFLLAYFASPIRFLVMNTAQIEDNPMLPVLGTLTLVGGIVGLIAIRPRS
jgi:uncharacterized membrane protein YedE/YeeE